MSGISTPSVDIPMLVATKKIKMEVYTSWENDVFEGLKAVKEKLDKNEKSKSLYNGFYVWDSKFIEEPEIMFIGINPGNGNPFNDRSKIEVKPCSQMSYLEYLDGDNPTYTIAQETVKAFSKAGYSKEEIRNLLNDNSVKTNYYYLITNGESDIKTCLDASEKGGFGKYWQKSFNWTGRLIEIVKPKIIICEGKGVFDELVNMTETKNTTWENDCGYFKNGETIILGYARRYSAMKNADAFAELIKKYIKNK